MDYQKLSKEISYALRHAPWEYELELDDEGWVPLAQLLDSLNSDRASAPQITRANIEQMMNLSGKQRHELAGDQIRALYGHSLPGKLKRQPKSPPELLYHGTGIESIDSIKRTGLQPMARQYVHLSTNQEMARLVGSRKGPKVAILTVRAREAAANGIAFYEGNDQVWLADQVPASWIEFP